METLRELLRIGSQYPGPVSMIFGTLGAYALGLLVEYYAIPITMTPRHQQGITVLVVVGAGTLLSSLIWNGLVASKALELRSAASFTASAIAMFAYPALGRWATSKWPGVGSIWAAPK